MWPVPSYAALPPGELGPACTLDLPGVSQTPTRRMAAQQAPVRIVALVVAALAAKVVNNEDYKEAITSNH